MRLHFFSFLVVFNNFFFNKSFCNINENQIEFIVKVQDVNEETSEIKDKFTKSVFIDKNIIENKNKDKNEYTVEELINLLNLYNDNELKQYKIADMCYFIEILNVFIFFSEQKFVKDVFFSDSPRYIFFRPKRKNKYDFNIHEKYIIEDNFKTECITGKIIDFTKDKFIERCLKIKKKLNSDNFCFLNLNEFSLFLNHFLGVIIVFLNNKFYMCVNPASKKLDVSLIFADNDKFKFDDFCTHKNLYYCIEDLLFSNDKNNKGLKIEYSDIKYVKINGEKVYDFEKELKNNTIDQINENLKKISIKKNSNVEVFLNKNLKDLFSDNNSNENDNKSCCCKSCR